MLRCKHRTGDPTFHFERETEGQRRSRGRYEGSEVS